MAALLLLSLLLLNLNLDIGICLQCPVSVSCSENNTNILELPPSVKLPVHGIDHRSNSLEISDPEECLPELFLRLNYSSSLFYPFKSIRFYGTYQTPLDVRTNVTFFNCSSRGKPLPCPIHVADNYDLVDLNLVSCKKLVSQLMPVPTSMLQENSIRLIWNTSFQSDHQCFVPCNRGKRKHKVHESIILQTAGAALLLSILGALYLIYHYYRNKGEDQQRVETFLKNYEALNPTRFSYANIKRITKQFKDKLGEGAHGAVYKGKLSNQILVAVKILNTTEGDGKEFINEVGTMAKIHHVNVVRLLGYCADGSHRALVYHFFPKGNLQNFMALPSNKERFLGWNKLHQIALGIAKGIEYLHQGCDQRILHFAINPRNVLLDESFTPKISDFGLAKLCPKNRSTVSMTAARGTLGYMAPEVFSRNFGNVSYKSDIYSYGMLLLEMVGGRKNANSSEETFQVLYPNWIHSLLEGDDTYIPIDDDGDFRIAKKLAIVGLWCIQWHPVHRPSMKGVVQMLEGGEEQLKVPPNPFESAAASSSSAIIPARCLNLELEVIPETD
ncbi:hypothetical protein PIB30_049652 [Stylosanthes scabra]|uniref:Protein kinase domain-containing protein n=1 Tax=Stylosanthes scabra TaxID=79078 RepID=A0ABU6SHM7_9FABA|nr:hypothetical protein [Stylosanthes scabra]